MTRPTQADIDDWNAFLNDPEHASVRKVAERYPPWEMFELAPTGQVVAVVSYFDDGTVKVYVDPAYNSVEDWRTGFEVFGINPDELKPWRAL